MKIKEIIDHIVPAIGNCKSNKKIKNKIERLHNNPEESLILEELCVNNLPKVSDDSLKQLYEETKSVKDKLEDKAKATIVSVTVSISLILGGATLLNTIATSYASLWLRWICFGLFCYAVVSMIGAAILDIKVLVQENIVETIPADSEGDCKRENYYKSISINRLRNTIRNNYVYSAFECIRNGLICLFLIMIFAVLPIKPTNATSNRINNARVNREYTYSEATLKKLEQYNNDDIKNIIEAAIPSMQLEEDKVYSIVDRQSALFIKFKYTSTNITVIEIAEVTWEQ